MCKISISVFLFRDDNKIVNAYCPSLNLIGVGNTEQEAKNDFELVVKEHFEWCAENGTIVQDMERFGWKFSNGKAEEPSLSRMLRDNSMFRSIMKRSEYKKYSRNREVAMSV